jgi:aldose 1-epimerase
MIVLDDGRARVAVHPDQGAAVGRYDLIDPAGNAQPILQTAPAAGREGPFALGLNLLVPFSNRISGGGFWHGSVFHRLERNTADPYPIHGNGFTLPWSLREATGNRALLTLSASGPGPFRYDAEVAYGLADGALTARLMLINRAATSLPYGAGFHPWFVRSPRARLTMNAAGYWTETADHLPDTYLPCAGDERFDFSHGRALPTAFFNNAVTGWDGRARLDWPDRGIAVEIVAPPPLTTVILYSPASTADFVCVEPVSHSVDAHNRRETGAVLPQILEPGQALMVEVTIMPVVLA